MGEIWEIARSRFRRQGDRRNRFRNLRELFESDHERKADRTFRQQGERRRRVLFGWTSGIDERSFNL